MHVGTRRHCYWFVTSALAAIRQAGFCRPPCSAELFLVYTLIVATSWFGDFRRKISIFKPLLHCVREQSITISLWVPHIFNIEAKYLLYLGKCDDIWWIWSAGIQVSFESRRRPPFCLGNTFCTRSHGQNTIANAEATNHQNYHVASGTKM